MAEIVAGNLENDVLYIEARLSSLQRIPLNIKILETQDNDVKVEAFTLEDELIDVKILPIDRVIVYSEARGGVSNNKFPYRFPINL